LNFRKTLTGVKANVAHLLSFDFENKVQGSRGSESIEKVLNREIGFQDHKKVLTLAKRYINY